MHACPSTRCGPTPESSPSSVDLDIHRWAIRVSDFELGTEFAADMLEVERLYGYSYLELELIFTPYMHPFYPVYVKVVRPRFEGFAAEAAMSHPMLTLQVPLCPASHRFLDQSFR